MGLEPRILFSICAILSQYPEYRIQASGFIYRVSSENSIIRNPEKVLMENGSVIFLRTQNFFAPVLSLDPLSLDPLSLDSLSLDPGN